MRNAVEISQVYVDAALERPWRVALVSDTHGRFPEELGKLLKDAGADAIAIVGDLVDTGRDYADNPELWSFLRLCGDTAPTYYALGNHERDADARNLAAVARTGVTVLDNKWAELGPLKLGGLTSGYFGPKKRPGGVPNRGFLEEFSREPGYKVLLCHHPEYYPRYIRATNIQLTLSGHAHGGQIRLAGRGLYAPGQGIFPAFTSGLYENRLVVSPGLCNTAPLIPRLGNPRQLLLVNLRAVYTSGSGKSDSLIPKTAQEQ